MRRRTPVRHSPKNTVQPIGPVQSFEVDGLTHDAKGVARLQGKVTFIEGALPGEVVEARVTKAGRRFDEARLSNIIQASSHRVSPSCSHFDQCGGCSFQHLAQAQQIEAKTNWLQGQLRNLSFEHSLDILSDSAINYRRRARIAVQVKNNQLLLGFRGKASKDIVSIDTCIVLTKALQKIFTALKQVLLGNELADKLGHIELLEDSKGVSVLFRLTASIDEAHQKAWGEWAKNEKVDLYWQAPKANKASVLEEDMRYYDLDSQRLRYHPQDFIQVNAAMNEKMVAQALAWLKPDDQDVILDLFCGVGNFSIPLAKHAQQVIGVEVQDSMVEAATLNADLNGLSNLSFLAADLTKPIAATFAKKNISKVLLDPPRAGAFEFLDTLIKIRPKQILYVSCNASTLARDAEYLVAKGYHVSRVGLMDMFPQTSHVETMMLLQKKK